LTYSFIETVVFSKGGYIMRAIGGAFFLTGMLIMAYNTYRTVKAAGPAADTANQPAQAPAV
jgi:cytochrome c oxidase cbb3-type subunit 1